MKIVSICKKCNGKGTINSCRIIKKKCPVCKGSGKTIKHISDIKKEHRKIHSCIAY